MNYLSSVGDDHEEHRTEDLVPGGGDLCIGGLGFNVCGLNTTDGSQDN